MKIVFDGRGPVKVSDRGAGRGSHLYWRHERRLARTSPHRHPCLLVAELAPSDSVLMKGTARPSVRCRAAAILTIAPLHPALERSNLPGMPTKAKPSVSKSAQKPPKSKAASLSLSSSYPARRAGPGGK